MTIMPVPVTTRDKATQSNYEDISATHLHLDWRICWDKKEISGSVTHSFVAHTDNVKEVHLDASYLKIRGVSTATGNLNFKLHRRHDIMGNRFDVYLPHTLSKGDTIDITIKYSTTEHCTALAWLDKQQTSGGDYPYVYSQCEAIHARSMVPCQDTPSSKFTYSSTVTSTLPALMSALRVSPPKSTPLHDVLDKKTVYHYNQPIPIPSYLLAIASGKLVYKSFEVPEGVTWDSGVWTEPE